MKKNELVRGEVISVSASGWAIVQIIHLSEFGGSDRPRQVKIFGDHHCVMYAKPGVKYRREFGPSRFALRRPEIGDKILLTRSFNRPDLAYKWAFDHDDDVVTRPVDIPVTELFCGRANLARAS